MLFVICRLVYVAGTSNRKDIGCQQCVFSRQARAVRAEPQGAEALTDARSR